MMETTTTAIDPVRDMTVDPTTARRTSECQGTTVYFCSPGCKKAFDADPATYVGEAASEAAPEQVGGCACCRAWAQAPSKG
jgi:YHS domain-containing protein